jgi:hypothetical protein
VVALRRLPEGAPAIIYQPFEEEPSRLFPRRTPPNLILAAPLAAGRLTLRACLLVLRLAVSGIITAVAALVLLNLALAFSSGGSSTAPDMAEYLTGVLRFTSDWESGDRDLGQETSRLLSEVSSTGTSQPAAPGEGGTAGLVALLAPLSPPQLRELYEEALPALQQYDAMLGDVQAALAENRDLDGFFSDVEPWLKQAEEAAASP